MSREKAEDWESVLDAFWASNEKAPTLLTDLNFFCKDGTIQAHKFILQKVCNVFVPET